MADAGENVRPRTFFLNEAHELSPIDKTGGGRVPAYVGIAWAAKAQHMHRSITRAMTTVKSSHDPLRESQYFLLARPEKQLEKRSKDKRKAPSGSFLEPTDFGDVHGRVFDRLGLSLVEVTDDGNAVVHGKPDRVQQLADRSVELETLGSREQARWAVIESFGTVPVELRVDADWLSELATDATSDVVFELQPVLSRVEADVVLRSVADHLLEQGGRLSNTGADFSGRHWCRGQATRRSVRAIARDYYSIQSIHSPLFSIAARSQRRERTTVAVRDPARHLTVDPSRLPCVAVVDLGVPTGHQQLAAYSRGRFVPQDVPPNPVGDHGAFVASRVVFGECANDTALLSRRGECSFYDVSVGDLPAGAADRINDKVVVPAMASVRGGAPDIRIFNLSFGDRRPLSEFSSIERREKRIILRDLDNFAFANDVAIVVAAGNSTMGEIPSVPYPGHHADQRWLLGPWACGFNTMVCGSYVSRLSAGGLVANVGWPSAFSRVGPGFCDAPVPSFCAEGGNCDDGYNHRNGLGVWGLSGAGFPEDRTGTSNAAPILAREVAKAMDALQAYCTHGAQPFAVTMRAFLALTATPTSTDHSVTDLARRTLGFGKAAATRVNSPRSGTAVLLWQGVIETHQDVVRVQLPIPKEWLEVAQAPHLRLAVAYDPPVNEAAIASWACRKVSPVLHLGPELKSVRAPRGGHPTYPLILRDYDLTRHRPGTDEGPSSDSWILELSYEEIFDYPPSMTFDPRQRVAFAAELVDRGQQPVDPQTAMQRLPNAASMTRLSVLATPLRVPAIVRNPL